MDSAINGMTGAAAWTNVLNISYKVERDALLPSAIAVRDLLTYQRDNPSTKLSISRTASGTTYASSALAMPVTAFASSTLIQTSSTLALSHFFEATHLCKVAYVSKNL